MDIDYLVGEPVFDVRPAGEIFCAPGGQAHLCQDVLKSEQRVDEVKVDLRREYVSIVEALQAMNLTFRIAIAHPRDVDGELDYDLKRKGCVSAAFTPDYFPPSVVYPRDFCTIVNDHLLLNPTVQARSSSHRGFTTSTSLYGEGGRVIFTDRTAVIANRVIPEPGGGRGTRDTDFSALTAAGLKVVQIPAPVAVDFNLQEVLARCFSNDHIDRVACLLKGKDERDHLIINPHLFVGSFSSPASQDLSLIAPEEAITAVRAACEPQGIVVHQPSSLRVPYSLNLLQVDDGRVLMTSGDPDVENLVRELVGANKVTTTRRVIRSYPTWLYAGIRCLVNDFPSVLFNKIS